MTSNSFSQHIYTEKIHRAIDYISKHISEEINLDQLADVACFSPFHFHRVFTACVGETPRGFIERIKLERAANNLCLLPHKSVADIASDCGFSSASTFTRAFKKYYQIPPREFLNQHRHDFHSMNIPGYQPKPVLNNSAKELVRIVKLPALHVAYTQTLNGYQIGIPKAWNRLNSVAAIKGWINVETRFVGVPYDNPGITPREKCRYRACITVDKNMVITRGDVKTADLEEGNYAVFHFKGTTKDISDAYSFLYGEWLPQSGYMPDNKPLLELYPPELHTQSNINQLEYDIALPVTII
jgi:AraC family transcriptional regulator